jgi:hypothetical protein
MWPPLACTVMVLRNFEDRLERLVEGMFARAFKSGLEPVEIGRRLVKTMDANRNLDVRGRTIAPNSFDVKLASSDFERFAQIEESLRIELATIVREHAQSESMLFLGRVAVALTEHPPHVVGIFSIEPSFDEAATEGVPPAHLELADGRRIPLANTVATFGRLPESTLQLDDPNASRRHAELRPDGDSFVLVDLGSTNGSKVNGTKVHRQHLNDGDELTFGTITLTFRLL